MSSEGHGSQMTAVGGALPAATAAANEGRAGRLAAAWGGLEAGGSRRLAAARAREAATTDSGRSAAESATNCADASDRLVDRGTKDIVTAHSRKAQHGERVFRSA